MGWNRNKIKEKRFILAMIKNKKSIIIFIICSIGILIANIVLMEAISRSLYIAFTLLISITLFTMTLIFIVKNIENKPLKRVLIIPPIAFLLVFAILFGVLIPFEIEKNNSPECYGPGSLGNSKFESYFGNNITATEVKNLLSEIRTNNLIEIKESENVVPSIIGVCYISKSYKGNPIVGVSTNDIDPRNIKEKDFDKIEFTANVTNIPNVLYKSQGKTFTVGVASKKAYHEEKTEKTGFETEQDPLGKTVTGNSGGYYKNGAIRLIYIIDNDNTK